MNENRCKWVNINSELYIEYHDTEWGVPVYDGNLLFEMLILEGAQAGLSWETVLNKRQGYRSVFYKFDIVKVAQMSDCELEEARHNPKIIRNKLKIYSTRKNAQVALEIKQEFGSLADYFWSFVNNKPVVNRPENLMKINVTTVISDKLSSDLKNRGMNFVGSTIMYAFMQATGMVNDHSQDCYLCPN